MNKIEKIIIFFGYCDLGFFALITILLFSSGHVPIYDDIVFIYNNIQVNFKMLWQVMMFDTFNVFFYISLIFSGSLLVLRKGYGAIFSWVQAPFRVFMVGPTLFFIFVPLLEFFEETTPFGVILLFYASEAIRLWILFKWQKLEAHKSS